MFVKKPKIISSTTTDLVLYRRFIHRYKLFPDFMKFCYRCHCNPYKKSSYYKFLVSIDYMKWFEADVRMCANFITDKTIFEIARTRWLDD